MLIVDTWLEVLRRYSEYVHGNIGMMLVVAMRYENSLDVVILTVEQSNEAADRSAF